MAESEQLDLAACRADIERAYTEVGDIAAEGAHRRWRMSIPAQPDRDSDLILSAGLEGGEQLASELERLRAELVAVERVRGRLDALIADGFGATTDTLRDLRAALGGGE